MSSFLLMVMVRFVFLATAILCGSGNNAAAGYLELKDLGRGCFQTIVQECTSVYDGDRNNHLTSETSREWRRDRSKGEALAEVKPSLDRRDAYATRGAEGAFSRVLGFTQRNLQKGFTKHGADLGLTGNWNPARAADFSRAVNQHINAPGVRAITGTYRGNPATHFLDPRTGVNVIADPAGNYVSGWKLGAEQLESVLTTGRLF